MGQAHWLANCSHLSANAPGIDSENGSCNQGLTSERVFLHNSLNLLDILHQFEPIINRFTNSTSLEFQGLDLHLQRQLVQLHVPTDAQHDDEGDSL